MALTEAEIAWAITRRMCREKVQVLGHPGDHPAGAGLKQLPLLGLSRKRER